MMDCDLKDAKLLNGKFADWMIMDTDLDVN